MKWWRIKGRNLILRNERSSTVTNSTEGASVSRCLSVGGVEEDGMRTACLGAVVGEEVTDRM